MLKDSFKIPLLIFVFIVGDDLGSYLVDSSNIGLQEQSNPSLAWLMPKDLLWGPEEIILQADNLNATTQNFDMVNLSTFQGNFYTCFSTT